ncbi:hypothetical protein [uncultured Rikenella sp.]|uniref:hypothetical protein n=1 Tax=uncultured Rikenella sp. TaxID=368003 RepID=UPI002605E963|nr:hypothetical protein [uncultured Rikenella sp.]
MPLGINGGKAAAPGFRSGSAGIPNSAGNEGYSLSTGVSNTYSQFLWFHTHGLDPGNTYSRAYGRQLRCLSE